MGAYIGCSRGDVSKTAVFVCGVNCVPSSSTKLITYVIPFAVRIVDMILKARFSLPSLPPIIVGLLTCVWSTTPKTPAVAETSESLPLLSVAS